ncbi:hypothetical protein K458DRAFT_489853 [Lentithecium fluviatile CBS 122367]|uniref:Uncharacterized protein n=1 Tax=Lentithecium fluviatile CBS 122367 TaxID=1168545 RepID=A0A6G1IRU4_9PLEO|nr:hypothetical protein K458DRAFT_489853 [Lentithecium fluviatile CBS 122367]
MARKQQLLSLPKSQPREAGFCGSPGPQVLLALIGLGLAAPGVVDVFLRAGIYVHERLNENKKGREFATNLKTFYIDDEVDILRLYMKSARAIVTDARTDAIEKARLDSQFQEIKTLLKSIHDFTSMVLSSEWDRFDQNENQYSPSSERRLLGTRSASIPSGTVRRL